MSASKLTLCLYYHSRTVLFIAPLFELLISSSAQHFHKKRKIPAASITALKDAPIVAAALFFESSFGSGALFTNLEAPVCAGASAILPIWVALALSILGLISKALDVSTSPWSSLIRLSVPGTPRRNPMAKLKTLARISPVKDAGLFSSWVARADSVFSRSRKDLRCSGRGLKPPPIPRPDVEFWEVGGLNVPFRKMGSLFAATGFELEGDSLLCGWLLSDVEPGLEPASLFAGRLFWDDEPWRPPAGLFSGWLFCAEAP